ncbi:hypothetical protein FX016_11365 [Cupriavidus gilardii]|nr:hypothetical protein FX016_11365 [Cupriavidus gilardii]
MALAVARFCRAARRRLAAAVRPLPFALCRSPFAVRPLPFALCRSPFAVRALPFALCRSSPPFAVARCGGWQAPSPIAMASEARAGTFPSFARSNSSWRQKLRRHLAAARR